MAGGADACLGYQTVEHAVRRSHILEVELRGLRAKLEKMERERDEALAANKTLEDELRSCLVSLVMQSPMAPNREQADYLAAQAIARLKGGE